MPCAVCDKFRREDGIFTIRCKHLNDIVAARKVRYTLFVLIDKLVAKAEAFDRLQRSQGIGLGYRLRTRGYETDFRVSRCRTVAVEIPSVFTVYVVVAPVAHILNFCLFQRNRTIRSSFKLRLGFTNVNVGNHEFALQTAHLEDEAGEEVLRFAKGRIAVRISRLCPRTRSIQINRNGVPFTIGNNGRREDGIRTVRCDCLNDIVYVFVRYILLIFVYNSVTKREAINRLRYKTVKVRHRVFGYRLRTGGYEANFRIARCRTVASKVPNVFAVYVVVTPRGDVFNLRLFQR